jgi:hypothetical protein
MKLLFTVLSLLAVATVAQPAWADADDSGADYVPEAATRRSEVSVGLHLGGAVGQAEGYPNELEKIGASEFESDTGFAGGMSGSLWLGAALRDWFTFGVGVHLTDLSGGTVTSSGLAVVLHIEGFPLFYEGAVFQDLGVFSEVGASGRTLSANGEEVAEGGFMSFVSGGVLYEPLRLGAFSAGPALQYAYEWSESLSAHAVFGAFRVVYYGGPR